MDPRLRVLAPIPALAFVVFSLCAAPAWAERSVDGEEELLPIWETPEELAFRASFPRGSMASDPPPTAPIRNVGEFEPATGALIRYPLGIPYTLIHELTEDVMLHVIVDNANHANAVANFNAQGVNMSQVEFIIAPNNSIWTRDYGPWFVFDGNGDQVILDHFYNRPLRPDDNQIPRVLAQHWGIPWVTHDLWHTGGNYMTEGHGLSYSTDLVWNENAGMSHAQIAQFMSDYYGVDTYNVLPDISPSGIHHIDTWGKLLDEETVLVKQVQSNHADYPELEANALTIAGLTNKYGRPFRVVRVFCGPIPSGVASYTNSLILNNRVLVPTFNRPAEDAAALQVYRDNMPGYEVLGFYHSAWLTDDALHCRVMGIYDRFMLRVDHNPVQEGIEGIPVPVLVNIDDRSETGLNAAATALHWRIAGEPTYVAVPLAPEPEPDWYVAEIPGQPAGTDVEYYVTAADMSGRDAARPRPAPLAAYRFTFQATSGVDPADAPPAILALDPVTPNPFNPSAKVRFHLPEAAPVRLSVMDITGREVARLIDRTLTAGDHQVMWEGRTAGGGQAPSGIYLMMLEAGGQRLTQRAVLLK
jgi:agmatine/peptidylarginine deiminase